MYLNGGKDKTFVGHAKPDEVEEHVVVLVKTGLFYSTNFTPSPDRAADLLWELCAVSV